VSYPGANRWFSGELVAAVVVALLLTPAEPFASPVRAAPEQVETTMARSDCASCHSVDRTVVGPSYLDVALRYVGQAGAAVQLGRSIREGGSGRWGDVPMTPHPDLDDAEIEAIAAWILSLEPDTTASAEAETGTRPYTYALGDGTSVDLDFPLFVNGEAPRVTREVFNGYLMYNSYCYRCHGQDATASQLAPDLKRSLDVGMTLQEYLSVTMAGREADGMPSWAGFLSEEEVRNIYKYVQGRRLGLVPVGRPPSDY
jgi:cytochrome c